MGKLIYFMILYFMIFWRKKKYLISPFITYCGEGRKIKASILFFYLNFPKVIPHLLGDFQVSEICKAGSLKVQLPISFNFDVSSIPIILFFWKGPDFPPVSREFPAIAHFPGEFPTSGIVEHYTYSMTRVGFASPPPSLCVIWTFMIRTKVNNAEKAEWARGTN